MNVAVFFSPPDGDMAKSILLAFRDAGIKAFGVKLDETWKEMQMKDLSSRLSSATHGLVLWTQVAAGESWLPFVAGYAQGRSSHFALYRVETTFAAPAWLSAFPSLDSLDEMASYYVVERQKWLEENDRITAKRELFERGLAFSQSSMSETIRDGDLAALELFVRAGLPPNSRDKHGVPLICQAVRAKHRRIVEYLLKTGARVDDQAEDRGNSALMEAVATGQHDVVEDLLAAGAKTDLLSKDGQTALIIAVGKNDVPSAKALLGAGADADIPDKLGFSARKYATLFHNPEMISAFEGK